MRERESRAIGIGDLEMVVAHLLYSGGIRLCLFDVFCRRSFWPALM